MTLIEQPITEEIPPSTEPKIEISESTDDYGKFVIEPLERGFGVTLGNALRRVLLGSLTGAAITWVRIDGVQHEYSTIPFVKEDVSEFLLNIKSVRIKPLSDRPGTLRLEVQGPGQVTAGDIQPSADFEIVNSEQHLASMDSDKSSLSVEIHVDLGKGYLPAAHTEGMPIGVLPVDAIFSPVWKVNYKVENTRVGQAIDFERLALEVWTDGAKTPQDSVKGAAQALVDSFFRFVALGQVMEGMGDGQTLAHAIPADQYNMPIEKLDLSARTLNCLKRAKINKVGEAMEKSRDELLKIKNFGEKSLTELYERLEAHGLVQPAPEIQQGEAPGEETADSLAPGATAIAEETTAPPAALADADHEDDAARGKAPIRDLSALRAALLGEQPDDAQEPEAPAVSYPADLAEEPEDESDKDEVVDDFDDDDDSLEQT